MVVPQTPVTRLAALAGEVEDVIVTVREGKPVYVGDIATVRLDYQDPSHVVREMGQTAIAVNAIRETGANVLDAMHGLRQAVEELNEDLLTPLGFKIYQVYDETLQKLGLRIE